MNITVEIAQNMSPSEQVEEYIEGENIIVTKRKSGDFVVCNLSSIHLGRANTKELLNRLIKIQVRMLDNVIDINKLPIKQAEITNKKYRAVGLGTFSYHEILAQNKLHWATDEAIEFTDNLYEYINYLTIKASHELATEKGAYPLFEGSDWNTGEYFNQRNYGNQDDTKRWVSNEQWNELAEFVGTYGIRNGYLMAVAPNGATSVLVNGTASIDPIFEQFFYEEKKDYKIPVVVPSLNHTTMPYYNNAYSYNQIGSVKQNAVRQKHIDQSQSFNIYVKNNIKASELLNIIMTAWKTGNKTMYYTRSTSTDIKECEFCGS